jgi:hypothetical protein
MKEPNIGTMFRHRAIAKTSQAGIDFNQSMHKTEDVRMTLGFVQQVNSAEMTCDVTTGKNTIKGGQITQRNGILHKHVPIVAKCGLDDASSQNVWGEFELPAIGSAVILLFILGKESFPIIIGTIFPYAHNLFQDGQVPVNSSSKQFTKKLLEQNLDTKTYRRVFKSGTSVEVKGNDGTIVVETPSGQYFELDESTGHFNLYDSHGNSLVSTDTSIKINGNLEILQ